jgi:hypothetical protein
MALASYATGQSGYNAATGQACIAGMQEESSSGTVCATLGNDIAQCSQVFATSSGTVPPGQPCQADTDCATVAGGGSLCFGQFVLNDGSTSQTQTCIQTMPGQAGSAPCIGTQNGTETSYGWSGSGAAPPQAYLCNTASGTRCDWTTQKCVALATVGQSCGSNSDCVSSAYCRLGSSAGQCTPRLADGASCTGATAGCLTTSYCDPTIAICKPLILSGSACDYGPACASGDCVNLACAASNSVWLQLLCGSQ